MNLQLAIEAQAYTRLREHIKLEYKLDDDDPVLSDTLDGSTNLHEQLARIVRQVQEDESTIDGLQKRINQMQARKSRLITRSARLRHLVAKTMTEVGLKRLAESDMTVSVRFGQRPLVFLEMPNENMPTEFIQRIESYSWNRHNLREAVELCNPRALELAKLGEPEPILTIHTK